MKKVININFQGRVIPIEETAYESLKQYIESLRRYFAAEEGKDEIINDIESRIAELFSERLKKGLTCITDGDVSEVIAGMGRPEDFEAQDGETSSAAPRQEAPGSTFQSSAFRGRLYRNADDKILGGVCSGLANYLRIDPVVMRVAFVLLSGVLFWVYVLLWVVVPSKSSQSNITKRLYRSQEHKVIGGVCGGIAAYFNIEVWIPRLIFALPFLIALVSQGFNAFWWDADFGFFPRVISGSFGSTLFVTYIILWITVPIASTAADKLEMRGEKVDLNSIRDTVKEDLENFKTKAEKWSDEVKQSAQNLGEQAKQFGSQASKTIIAEAPPLVRRTRNGLGHAIGVLFKAFFLFIAAIIAISLFSVFVALLFGNLALAPFKNFLLEGVWQNLFAWSTIFLFFGVPLVALVTWMIRRIVGVRSKNHYLGYIFGSLWFIGLVSISSLAIMVGRNFKNSSRLGEEQLTITQPSQQKMYVDVAGRNWRQEQNDFFGMDMDNDWPFYDLDQDSVRLNTIRLNMVKSNDSAFHVYRVKLSRGSSTEKATATAVKISYDITQRDSVLVLPRSFSISKNEKFRNQRVWIVIEVPVGKRIHFSHDIDQFNWFDVRYNHNGFTVEDNWNDRNDVYRPEPGVEYIMTPGGRPDRSDSGNTEKIQTEVKAERKSEREEASETDTDEETGGNPGAGFSTSELSSELSTPLSVFSKLF